MCFWLCILHFCFSFIGFWCKIIEDFTYITWFIFIFTLNLFYIITIILILFRSGWFIHFRNNWFGWFWSFICMCKEYHIGSNHVMYVCQLISKRPRYIWSKQINFEEVCAGIRNAIDQFNGLISNDKGMQKSHFSKFSPCNVISR